MRAGGREGRKQGGELEWAAVPVLRRCRLNFKHSLLFNHPIGGPKKWDDWPFWASMNQFPPVIGCELVRSIQILTESDSELWNRDAESGLVLFYLSVSSSCRLLRWWLPLVAHRAKVKEKPVRILIALRSNHSVNILLRGSYQSGGAMLLLLLFGTFTVLAVGRRSEQTV